jgi:hypothetical protein
MHKAPATPLTQLKERMARFRANHMHLCYGKRCARHTNGWYAWTVAR